MTVRADARAEPDDDDYRPSLPGTGAVPSCSSATCSPPWSAAVSRRRTANVDAVAAAHRRRAVVVAPMARHLFAARARARLRLIGAARHRAAAAASPVGACWCAASSTACRCISPARWATAPISARRSAALRKLHARRHHPQRSRQGAELAARRRRPRLPHRFPARRAFRRRSQLFRLAAYEDLRHYLKHKRSYVPEALTADREAHPRAQELADAHLDGDRQAGLHAVTRGLFRFTDREGGGPRLVNDAPAIAARLQDPPEVRDVVVRGVPRPPRRHRALCVRRRRAGATKTPSAISSLQSSARAKAPERLQVVDALPRRADGSVRSEILQLVAMNQLDQIDPLIADETERRIVARIVADRRNLRDRFTF